MKIEPGFWYIKTDFEPFYAIISVTEIMFGDDKGYLGVWMIDEEGYILVEDCGDIFIKPVPVPFGDY
jgi:hypothetical protein